MVKRKEHRAGGCVAVALLTAAGLGTALTDKAVAQTAPVGQPDSRQYLRSEAAEVASEPPEKSAAASAATQRIQLKLSGYFQQFGVISNQHFKTRTSPDAPSRDQSTNTVTQKHNSEVCVIGQTTLDNGLTIGVNIQIEANTSSDQIDESFLFLESPSLGRAEVGDTDNASYKLHVTAPDGGISIDQGDLCNVRAFELGNQTMAAGTFGSSGAPYFDSPLCTTNMRLNDNDSGKFNYFTPRYAGFQAGVSYIPEFAQGGGDNNSALQLAGTGNLNRASGQHDGFAAGLNFNDKVGMVAVKSSLGYLWAKTSNSSMGAATIGQAKDLNAYNAGAQFTIENFAFGGALLYVPQGTRALTTASNAPAYAPGTQLRFNGSSWTVGAAYAFGPYKIGLDYMKGTNNATTSGGSSRLEQAIVSGTWTMGPGIRFVSGAYYYDWQEENKLSQNNGFGAITGLKIGF